MARTMLRTPTPTPQPAATTNRSVVSLSKPTQRRGSWVLIGALMVGLAGLLGAWVFAATSKQISVVVAAVDVGPGEILMEGDLRVVQIGASGDLRAIRPNQRELIVGRAARGPIPAGTVLNTGLFTARGESVPAGRVVAGASLDAGAVPTAGLRAGDAVNLLAAVRTTGTATGTSVVATLLASGTVWSVQSSSPGASSSKIWISFVIPESAQGAVAQAAADGLLRLTLVGSG